MFLLGCITKRTFCQCYRIFSLRVGALKNHRTIGLHRIAIDLLGPSVRDNNISATHALINGALVSRLRIIDVLQNFITLAANIHPLTVTGASLAHLVVHVSLVGENGVLLRGRLHGETSFAIRVTENSSSRSSGLKSEAEGKPLSA